MGLEGGWIATVRVLVVLVCLIGNAGAACTFPEDIRGNWTSSEKGTLLFTDDTVYDYPMPVSAAVSTITFLCVEQNGTRYMLQSTTAFSLFSLSFNAYLCLDFHRISDYKYWYQVGTSINPTNNERIYAQPEVVAVTLTAACDRPEPYEVETFNTLIKEGAVAAGLVEATCPDQLFHTFANGSLSSADGTTSCINTTLDVCADRTQMIQTYDPSCDASLTFASDGVYICLMDQVNDTTGVTYLHVWNNDTSIASGQQRINCYAFEKVNSTMVATLYPGACHVGQTSTDVTSPGILVGYNSITNTCVNTVESGPQILYYVAIGLGALLLIVLAVLLVCVIKKTKCRCITRLCRKKKIGHSESSLSTTTTESGLQQYMKNARREAPDDLFVARKPRMLGPLIEPYLAPPPKVELLYDVEPRLTSSRLMFRNSMFFSQISLKHK